MRGEAISKPDSLVGTKLESANDSHKKELSDSHNSTENGPIHQSFFLRPWFSRLLVSAKTPAFRPMLTAKACLSLSASSNLDVGPRYAKPRNAGSNPAVDTQFSPLGPNERSLSGRFFTTGWPNGGGICVLNRQMGVRFLHPLPYCYIFSDLLTKRTLFSRIPAIIFLP